MKYLGVDYGQKRIGLAVSDPLGMMAMPWDVRTVSRNCKPLEVVRTAAAESEADAVVLGLPLNMDGTSGPMAAEVNRLANDLRDAGLKVYTWDERLTTAQSERVLLETDMSRARRKQVRDKLAAQAILQGFLDSL